MLSSTNAAITNTDIILSIDIIQCRNGLEWNECVAETATYQKEKCKYTKCTTTYATSLKIHFFYVCVCSYILYCIYLNISDSIILYIYYRNKFQSISGMHVFVNS